MNTAVEIQKSLEVFATPGDVVELRVIDAEAGYRKENLTGCFNDLSKMALEAAKLDGHAPAIYFTLNRCNPLIFARAPNKVIKSKDTTSDNDIIRRRWFPIDADAIKPAGVSSPDGLHEAALAVADDIEEWLTSQGWPKPVKGDSGNGGHLCYRIDLPNDKATTDLVKAASEVIADRFKTDQVDVDRKVFNAARIWKLYGTIAGKGENIPGQPHRRAKILNVPEPLEVVPLEMIQKIAGMKQPASLPSRSNTPAPAGKEIDVEEKCQKWGLNIAKVAPWKDGTKYIIKPCPFNSSHLEGIIIKHPNGAVSFDCPHNSCSGNHWAELRAMFEEKPSRPAPRKPDLWEGVSLEEEPRELVIKDRINPTKDLERMDDELKKQAAGQWVTLEMPWSRLAKRSNFLFPGTVGFIAGPTKTGKSYFVMSLVEFLETRGIPWKYLPLEDDRQAWMWRMLAILAGDYSMTDKDEDGAVHRETMKEKFQAELKGYMLRVAENPRANVTNSAGETIVPPIPYTSVIEWVREAAKTCRVVIVDPFAQVDFVHKKLLEQQDAMIRELLGIVAGRNCTLVLVAHVGKRNGESANTPMTADSLQGSINLTRLAQTTLILDAHDDRESAVFRLGGPSEAISHNRTVIIAAARNGGGNRQRIALYAPNDRPAFNELGIIDVPETIRLEKARRNRK